MTDKLRAGGPRPGAVRAATARGSGESRRAERPPNRRPGAVWSDLPLFPEPRAPEPIVRGSRPDAGRPLAVRRRTPRAPRRLRDDRVPPRADSELLAADGVDRPGEAALAAGPRTAGLGRRAAAAIADLLLLGAIDALVVALTARLLGMPITAAADLPWPPLAAFLLLFDLATIVALTALGGQTLGKMAAGIRVVGLDGGPVPVSRAVARTVLSVLSALPAGLGFVGSLARSRRAGHDWLTGTQVVRAVSS